MTAPLPVKSICASWIAALALAFAWVPAQAAGHFANADDPALVAAGQQVYAQQCANCHGRRLQGQGLWQLIDQYAGRRAPAQDATGHTWQHSDDDIFHMTKFGRFPTTPANIVSYMPAFQKRLSDHEILAVMAFIKADWPIGIRASQSTLNPGFQGMPAGADKVNWTFPPTCNGSYQRWQATAK